MARSTSVGVEAVAAPSNLAAAARTAERGKRYRPDVLAFNFYREERLQALSEELTGGNWWPSPHRLFRIQDPKPRWISAAPYADRIVHHALCQVIGPHLERSLIDTCYANRCGRGSHRAVLEAQKLTHRYPYVLKVDIAEYFASVDRELLKAQLFRRFRNRALRRLLAAIIDAAETPPPRIRWFAGDDLLTPVSRAVGLPIGNLTSQLWANTYLGGFDHFVKEKLKVRGYVRYVDDFLLFGDSKAQLHEWRAEVERFLASLRLIAHVRKTVVRKTAEGTPFLGYVIWPARIRVLGASLRRYRVRLAQREGEARQASLAAWAGHTRLAGDYRRTKTLFKDL